MNDTLNAFATLLHQHRAAYVHTLPARLAQLESFAVGLAGRGREAGPLQDLERLAHSLAGSAGTFGFPDLGEAARALELAIGEVREGRGPVERVPAGATSLGTELRRVLRETGATETLQ